MPTKNVKVPGEKPEEFFSFEYDGETYTFEGSLKILNKPGFVRKNRNKAEVDLMFTIFEEIAGDEALAIIDEMETEEFEDLIEQFNNAVEKFSGVKVPKS